MPHPALLLLCHMKQQCLLSVMVEGLSWPRSLRSVCKAPFRSLPSIAIEPHELLGDCELMNGIRLHALIRTEAGAFVRAARMGSCLLQTSGYFLKTVQV